MKKNTEDFFLFDLFWGCRNVAWDQLKQWYYCRAVMWILHHSNYFFEIMYYCRTLTLNVHPPTPFLLISRMHTTYQLFILKWGLRQVPMCLFQPSVKYPCKSIVYYSSVNIFFRKTYAYSIPWTRISQKYFSWSFF